MAVFDKKSPSTVLKVHVCVYRCQFSALTEFDSVLGKLEIQSLFRIANAIWRLAGIQWVLQFIIDMKVSNDRTFSFEHDYSRAEFRQKLVNMSPKIPPVLGKRLWKVCLLHRFPIKSGGVYLPETGTVFFSELARRGESSSAILAHELGHSLGLGHVSAEDNLMNPDSLKRLHKMCQQLTVMENVEFNALLNADQIICARSQAALGPARERSKVYEDE